MIFRYRSLLVPLITIILYPTFLYASTTITQDIAKLCKDKPVILFGEQHKQPNSQKQFLDLVRYYGHDGDNIFVGLEIPADKQLFLEFTMLGATDFSYLPSIIDHPAYRKMIYSLGAMKKNITVKAIDADEDEDNRDMAMSMNLLSALSSRKYDKILVLVGNNHTIKNIQWHEDVGDRKKKYLAGHMIAGGVDPCSVQQLFRDSSPTSDAVLVKTDTEIAIATKFSWI